MITEFQTLNLRYAAIREQCASAFERINHMETVEAPSLSSQYILAIGQYEMRIFELSVEIKRWQRRFELRQQALNCGEKPDMIAIENYLDKEFSAFQEKLLRTESGLEKATAFFQMPTLSGEQSTQMRILYLNSAKRLHPDVNPDCSEKARELWLAIRDAYSKRDWAKLKYLCSLADTIADTPKTFPDTEEGEAALKDEIKRLESVLAIQQEAERDLLQKIPWTYKELLSNTQEVEKRQQELCEEIALLSKQISSYERKWRKEIKND